MMDENEINKLQRAAEFGTRFIPLLLRLRQARDQGEGVILESGEVRTLIEVLHVLRGGPSEPQ